MGNGMAHGKDHWRGWGRARLRPGRAGGRRKGSGWEAWKGRSHCPAAFLRKRNKGLISGGEVSRMAENGKEQKQGVG